MPLCTGTRDGKRRITHSLQYHSSGKSSDGTMSTHSKWNERGQPSQQTTSPALPHAEQYSSLSEAWEHASAAVAGSVASHPIASRRIPSHPTARMPAACERGGRAAVRA